MDKPRHPNVIHTWNMRRPVPVSPSVKNEITRQIPVRGVPQPQTPRPRGSKAEKPSEPA
jgi:hypothetical protein